MEALDANDYSIYKAAKFLGLPETTLRNWVLKSSNLNEYLRFKQAEGAVKAREKLDYMLDNLDPLDPRQASVLKDICKTLMDKYEPDLSKSEIDQVLSINPELDKRLKELLDE